MKIILSLLTLLTFSLIAMAAGTQAVVNHEGNCTASVPASWTVQGSFGMARSPDKKVSLAVSSPKHMSTIDEVAQTVPMVYPDDKVTKKSSSEFEMEGKAGNGKPNIYRAITVGAKLCLAEVQYESGTPAEAKTIVETLKGK